MMLYTNILLIDDDEDDREIFASAISRMRGVDRYVEYSCPVMGLQALKAREVSPDIIFLDLNMPKMNGLEFLEKLKTDSSLCSIPVVIFSTSNNYNNIKSSMDLGAMDYITKPYRFEQLIVVLNKLFGQ